MDMMPTLHDMCMLSRSISLIDAVPPYISFVNARLWPIATNLQVVYDRFIT